MKGAVNVNLHYKGGNTKTWMNGKTGSEGSQKSVRVFVLFKYLLSCSFSQQIETSLSDFYLTTIRIVIRSLNK